MQDIHKMANPSDYAGAANAILERIPEENGIRLSMVFGTLVVYLTANMLKLDDYTVVEIGIFGVGMIILGILAFFSFRHFMEDESEEKDTKTVLVEKEVPVDQHDENKS